MVAHVFTLANTGDAPLRIEDVAACCGVTANLSTNAIAVGTNATLRLTLTFHNQSGRVRKAVYVKSNDPKTDLTRLVIEAQVSAGR